MKPYHDIYLLIKQCLCTCMACELQFNIRDPSKQDEVGLHNKKYLGARGRSWKLEFTRNRRISFSLNEE